MLSDVIIALLINSSTSVVYALIKSISKSKCSECDFGCCKIKRDVVLEEKENEFEILHRQPNNDNNNNNI